MTTDLSKSYIVVYMNYVRDPETKMLVPQGCATVSFLPYDGLENDQIVKHINTACRYLNPGLVCLTTTLFSINLLTGKINLHRASVAGYKNVHELLR